MTTLDNYSKIDFLPGTSLVFLHGSCPPGSCRISLDPTTAFKAVMQLLLLRIYQKTCWLVDYLF